MSIFSSLRRSAGAFYMLLAIGLWSALLWAARGLHLVISTPALLHAAWSDWRFHAKRTPDCGYTLWQAVKFSFRMWWVEVRE